MNHADRIVVVGAGLSGLSAALYLTGAGYPVTVLERANHPGGRVGRYHATDYEIDSGATILTMPELIDDALAAVGSSVEDRGLRIRKLAPAYHARYADGSAIDLFTDPDAMCAEITRACDAEEAGRYLRLRRWLADVFAAEYASFLDTNFDGPLDLVSSKAARRDLRRLLALGAFGRLGPRVGRFLSDERLRRLFSFQALFAGVSPATALGIYGAIPHMDTSLGVYYPDGGLRRVAEVLAEALIDAGGVVELSTEATDIVYRRTGRRRHAERVVTADGCEFDCAAVVLTADLGSIERFGIRRRRLRASPSAVVAHGTIPAAVAARWAAQAHHTIDFGAAWTRTFTEITATRRRGALMSDPSLLLTRPAHTDTSLLIHRDGVAHEPLSLLAPCPNLVGAALDWGSIGPAYLRELLGVLESRGYAGIADQFTVDRLDTPQTWLDKGMLAGSPFSAAHTFGQTGPFRRHNRPRGIDNVVLAGCGTTPGVGVPTALISGKLAAERITGTKRTGDKRDNRQPDIKLTST